MAWFLPSVRATPIYDTCDTRQALFFGEIEVHSGASDARRTHLLAAGGVGGVGHRLHGEGRRRLPFREQAPKSHSDAGMYVLLILVLAIDCGESMMNDPFDSSLSPQYIATLASVKPLACRHSAVVFTIGPASAKRVDI